MPDATDEITRALRKHFVAHNARVALFAVLTAIVAVGLWILLHGITRWLALLVSSAVLGTEARMPARIDEVFWIGAGVLLFAAWIDRTWRTDDRPRDYKSPGEIAWDFLLAVPRITFGIFGTLSAWQRLNRHELATASGLVERLNETRRLPLHSLPVEIPADALRLKVLFALQMTQVIDIRRENRELWIVLNPLRPRSLAVAQPASRA